MTEEFRQMLLAAEEYLKCPERPYFRQLEFYLGLI